jgi:flavin reductase (DIM6/NTAB) family NADH-FMN oxidoreductase RutF
MVATPRRLTHALDPLIDASGPAVLDVDPAVLDVDPAAVHVDPGPAVDAATFRHAFRHVAATVGVLTVIARDGRPRGMTVTSLCALSVDPPTLLVCVDRATRTHGELANTDCFGLSVLSNGQHEIAARLARHGGNKALDELWVPNGDPDAAVVPPAIRGAVVHLTCAIDTVHAASTHDIVIGRVCRVAVAEEAGAPLLYHDGAFDRLAGSRIPLREALLEDAR